MNLKKSKYTIKELLEINSKLHESEKKNYDQNNAFWNRTMKDRSQIKRKYYAQVEDLLEAKLKQEEKSQTGKLF